MLLARRICRRSLSRINANRAILGARRLAVAYQTVPASGKRNISASWAAGSRPQGRCVLSPRVFPQGRYRTQPSGGSGSLKGPPFLNTLLKAACLFVLVLYHSPGRT
jgi:hypothetical protein